MIRGMSSTKSMDAQKSLVEASDANQGRKSSIDYIRVSSKSAMLGADLNVTAKRSALRPLHIASRPLFWAFCLRTANTRSHLNRTKHHHNHVAEV